MKFIMWSTVAAATGLAFEQDIGGGPLLDCGQRPCKTECIVPSDAALGGMVPRMACAIVRRPGKGEQVIVKLACGWFRVVVVMVMFGESEGSEAKKRTKQN